MATTPFRAVDGSDDHTHRSIDRLPRAANQLGCRTCGLPAQEHGRTVIHRFVRPALPDGYRYLDEIDVGDDRALHRRPAEQSTIVVAQPERALLPEEDGLRWLRTPHSDLFLGSDHDRLGSG